MRKQKQEQGIHDFKKKFRIRVDIETTISQSTSPLLGLVSSYKYVGQQNRLRVVLDNPSNNL